MVDKLKSLKRGKGFTLVEIMIVLGMVILLVVSVSFRYTKILEDNSLYDASERLLFVVQQTVEYSKQNVDNNRHGIYFGSLGTDLNRFYTYVGTSYAASTIKIPYILPEKIKIQAATFGANKNEVSFMQGTGKPTETTGTIRIEIKDKPTKYIILTMNSEGVWSLAEHY